MVVCYVVLKERKKWKQYIKHIPLNPKLGPFILKILCVLQIAYEAIIGDELGIDRRSSGG